MDLKAVRKLVNETLLQKNSIDRLFTDKVEDYILIEEQPMPIRIGSRTIYVGNFTLETEKKFFQEWAKIISLLIARIVNRRLAEERKKELIDKASFFMLADGKILHEFFLMDDWLLKQMYRLIDRTVLKQQAYHLNNVHERELINWTNCDIKYFKKNVTMETLIQICYMVYLYNFDSVKKNAILLLEKTGMKDLMETYVPFWLQNMPGLTGKFLAALAPNIDFILQGSRNANPTLPKTEQETSDG